MKKVAQSANEVQRSKAKDSQGSRAARPNLSCPTPRRDPYSTTYLGLCPRLGLAGGLFGAGGFADMRGRTKAQPRQTTSLCVSIFSRLTQTRRGPSRCSPGPESSSFVLNFQRRGFLSFPIRFSSSVVLAGVILVPSWVAVHNVTSLVG